MDDGGASGSRRGTQHASSAALDTLVAEADKRGIGDSSKKAAVGFCFGGGNVLELARSGSDVDAVVAIHADLGTTMPAKKGDIKAAVFVIHGSKDPVAPKAERDTLEAEMDGAEANWQMLVFGGRLHSFRRGRNQDARCRRIRRRRRCIRPTGFSTTSSRTRSTRSSDKKVGLHRDSDRSCAAWNRHASFLISACSTRHRAQFSPRCLFAIPAQAQTYPNKPIRVVVSIAAGSVTDVIMLTAAAGRIAAAARPAAGDREQRRRLRHPRRQVLRARRSRTAIRSASSTIRRCRSIRCCSTTCPTTPIPISCR